MKIFVLVLGLFALSLQGVRGQQASRPSVQVLANPAKAGAITLRWAPSNPIAWKFANQHGYVLERYTLLRDGQQLPRPERRQLTPQALKPLPLDAWEPLVKADKRAAITAQALYGQSFNVTAPDAGAAMSITNQVQEQEQRWSMALYAADLSADVADASGLRFVDKDVKANEMYLYRVYTQVPREKYAIDTGFVYTGLAEYKALPAPFGLEGTFSDRQVMLQWNKVYHAGIYIGHHLERAGPDGRFVRITDDPVINTETTPTPTNPYIYYLDSLPENGVEYRYRIVGLTPFGETGPPSEEVAGKGVKVFSDNPSILKSDVINGNTVTLTWRFPDEDTPYLKGFSILRSNRSNGQFIEISQGQIPPAARQFTDEKPLLSNYYRVKAIGNEGQEVQSFPFLVQLEDSIPPAPPVGLKGEMDTLGVVKLEWTANTEDDLSGYRVYRANYAHEEFSQITVGAVKDVGFYDTVQVKTMSKAVYYKITAVDLRHNPSAFSEVLAVKRPDLLPPVPPVFKQVKNSPQGAWMKWVNSSSNDVEKHVLYRRKAGAQDWELLATFGAASDSVYADDKTPAGQPFEYVLLAVDDSGLESVPAGPIKGMKIDTGVRPQIANVRATPDREQKKIVLSWQYGQQGVEKFLIYRAEKEDKARLYQTVPAQGNRLTFQDSELTINTEYKYFVQAVFADGAYSAMSKEVKVMY